MYRNDRKVRSIGLLLAGIVALVMAITFSPAADLHAEPLKVCLLLGDTHTGTAIEAIKAVQGAIRGRWPSGFGTSGYDGVSFYAYPTRGIQKRDLKDLRESVLVIISAGDRRLVEAVSPALEAVSKRGGVIYAVGGGDETDHRKMGMQIDEKINAYYRTRVVENLKNMILYALKKTFSLDLPYGKPEGLPDVGVYDNVSGKVFPSVGAYREACGQRVFSGREEKPWVGVLFYRTSLESGQMKPVQALVRRLEAQGFNVLTGYGYPTEAALERIFLAPGAPKIRLLVALGAKMAQNSETVIPFLNRLNIPVINAIALASQSEAEWLRSPVGLDILERGWQVAGPEMAGIIQPTVIASKERNIDYSTGLESTELRPIPERIESLTARVKAWINLQDKPNRDKRIALIYYNYPPGKQNIGAAYLNVLPESLYEIAARLDSEGYDLKGAGFGGEAPEKVKERLFNDISRFARNIGNWAPGELDRMTREGKPILIPLDTYRKWFAELPEGFRKSVLKSWGPVGQSKVMVWQVRGEKFLVLPAVRYGNILFAPQPSRGWEQDENKLYHDVLLPPHHQYIAFYLWLKHWFRADAVAHIGTHGTHEWLPGKEVGFTREDPPEVLIGDLPNIYPYNVDNVAEGIQAKRRGSAVVIDHMTPPFDRAGLNRELKEMVSLLNDYRIARDKSPSLAAAKLEELNALARKIGLTKDLGIGTITAGDVETLDDYLTGIAEKQTPFGLHTFGKSPEERYRKSTAEAILSLEKGLEGAARMARLADLEERIRASGPRELDSFLAALAGRYIPAGLGADPIRNPGSLPTGNNFYGFDPARVPPKTTYELGTRLATELIEGYRQRHGAYPDKLTYNLWAEETIRNEGVMESQVLNLMGVRPKWDERGRVTGIEAIPRKELGRQRIDVTLVPSGLYRDLFSNLMVMLDKAVSLAKNQDEDDNRLRAHVLKTKKVLMEKGIAEDKAERLASVRIFTEPSGAYGTNLANVIPKSNTWDNERQVADVYFMRMSHLFGQGFWSAREEKGSEDISRTLLQSALAGSKMAIHSRSSNLYATLDNNDFFQYLGGTAMAIRTLDGKTPEVYVTNLADPKIPKQETLEKVMGREMRSRYLNPEWIKAMMGEGYAGARFVDGVVGHLWGWQVTVPEAVDGAKWNEMYETYVLDRNGLDIKGMFRRAKNMYAYQSLVARMLETIRKDYWKADDKIVETLAREYAASVNEVGLACCDHTCNNPRLTAFTSNVLLSVPGLKSLAPGFSKALDTVKQPANAMVKAAQLAAKENGVRASAPDTQRRFRDRPKPAPDKEGQKVVGYEMQEVGTAGSSSAPIPYLFILGFLIFVSLIAIGFRKK